ncbi:putative beta-lysine N-acetyltransferase [Paenibacillus alkalitolerans]|uniref:putative beta-lysine N-acetyltransferase n=1 Tax=Paenibacillus alkalitolerans TaxID=2799335 RepID=UPI0018F36CD5|nr:putative beta-lysine N-acetyltransferase [Paenibacillus alkalitolerans]
MPKDDPYYIHRVESGNDCTVQYCLDFFNKRLRVDDYRGDARSVLKRASEIAIDNALTKVFIKSREQDWQSFLSSGCMLEGIYKGYFNGHDAYCMAIYFSLERRTSDYWMEEDQILGQVLALPPKPDRPRLPEGCSLRIAAENDARPLAALYAQTFRTYPTPMDDSRYIEQAVREGTIFYVIEADGRPVSAASAEINAMYRNAEITDCATVPAYRNKGLMRLLVHALENELNRRGILCAYSLTRALSFGMNAVFFRMGYRYCGRLTKNCDIYDKFEDMNLWVKQF